MNRYIGLILLSLLFAATVSAETVTISLDSMEKFENHIDNCEPDSVCTTSDSMNAEYSNGSIRLDSGSTGFCGVGGMKSESMIGFPENVKAMKFEATAFRDSWGPDETHGIRVNGTYLKQFTVDDKPQSKTWEWREYVVDVSDYSGEYAELAFTIGDTSESWCDMGDHGKELSVRNVRINTSTRDSPAKICEGCGVPTDPDKDGLYEDLNGDDDVNLEDVNLLEENLDYEYPEIMDFSGDGELTSKDAAYLYRKINEERLSVMVTGQKNSFILGDSEHTVSISEINTESNSVAMRVDGELVNLNEGESLSVDNYELVADRIFSGPKKRSVAIEITEPSVKKPVNVTSLKIPEEVISRQQEEAIVPVTNRRKSEFRGQIELDFRVEEGENWAGFSVTREIKLAKGSSKGFNVSFTVDSPSGGEIPGGTVYSVIAKLYEYKGEDDYGNPKYDLLDITEAERLEVVEREGDLKVEDIEVENKQEGTLSLVARVRNLDAEIKHPENEVEIKVLPTGVVGEKSLEKGMNTVETDVDPFFEGSDTKMNIEKGSFNQVGGARHMPQRIKLESAGNGTATIGIYHIKGNFNGEKIDEKEVEEGETFEVGETSFVLEEAINLEEEAVATLREGEKLEKPAEVGIHVDPEDKVEESNEDNNKKTVEVDIEDDKEKKIEISLQEGWNMISVPSVEEPQPAQGFYIDSLDEKCELERYEGEKSWMFEDGEWSHPNAVQSSQGVYVRSAESCEANLNPMEWPATGDPVPNDKRLEEGWNMISVPEPMTLSQINGCEFRSYEGAPVWHYTGEEWQQLGRSANELQPDRGYLVVVQEECEMSFSQETGSPPTPSGNFFERIGGLIK